MAKIAMLSRHIEATQLDLENKRDMIACHRERLDKAVREAEALEADLARLHREFHEAVAALRAP